MSSKPLSFICKMRNTIKDVLLSRGYTEIPYQEEEEEDESGQIVTKDTTMQNNNWDLIWASRAWIHKRMLGPQPIVLRPEQRINHFPNSFELTRKDLMAKNLERLRRDLRKTGQEATVDFYPSTYVLPSQFAMFLDDMKKKEGTWICKPVGGSMGNGILFLMNEAEANAFNAKTSKL